MSRGIPEHSSLTHSGHHGDSRRVGACEDAIDVDGELNTRGLAPIPIGGSYCPHHGLNLLRQRGSGVPPGGLVMPPARRLAVRLGRRKWFLSVAFLGGTPSNVATFCAPANCTSPVGCQASAGFNVAVSGSFALPTMYYQRMPGVTPAAPQPQRFCRFSGPPSGIHRHASRRHQRLDDRRNVVRILR